jgi:fused signal recognition particle receptor
MAFNFFKKLVGGLNKTQQVLVRGIDDVMNRHEKIDEEFYDDLEEIMIKGDIGVRTTEEILEELREKVREKRVKKPIECGDLLIESIRSRMQTTDEDYAFEKAKSVVLVIGVNGAGKTTSVGKLASIFKRNRRKVIIAAADTYRAAANEQLAVWANRAGVPIISGQDGADPGSVVYDAIAAAKARGAHLGRRPKQKPSEYIAVYSLWRNGEISARRAASRLGVDHKTFLKWTHEGSVK